MQKSEDGLRSRANTFTGVTPSSGLSRCVSCRHFGDEGIGADYCHLLQTILPPSWDFPQRCLDWAPRSEARSSDGHDVLNASRHR
jgi:hypothetical protein